MLEKYEKKIEKFRKLHYRLSCEAHQRLMQDLIIAGGQAKEQ